MFISGSKKIEFCIVGDMGGLPIYPYFSYAQKRVAEAIAKVVSKQEEPLNFVINVGDNFYFNGVNDLFDSRFEDSFEQIYEDPKLLVPWFTIAGNHDHLGNISAQIAHTNFSSKWTFPHLFYKIRIIFDYQKNITEEEQSSKPPIVLEILMLDTIVLCGNTEDVQGKSLFSWLFSTKKEPNGPEPEYEELAKRQWKWIEKQLKNSDADYLFVAGHYPIYSTCEHGGFQCLQKLDFLLHKFGVNAYFSGHDHNLQHIKIIKENIDKNNETFVDYIISGAASRTDRSAKHLNDIPEDSLLFRYPTGWNPFSQVGFSNGGFVQISVERDQSEFNFYDGKSRKRYSFKISPRKKQNRN